MIVLCKLVVGVDGSAGGRRAFEWSLGEAAAEVCAVHAISPSVELAIASIQVDSGPLLAQRTHELEGPWTATDREAPPIVITRLIEDAAPAALLAAARSKHADAIVVGAHGHDAPPRIVGATTSHLVHLSDCPVVVVPSATTGKPEDRTEPAPNAPNNPPDDRIVVAVGERPADDAELLTWAASAAKGPATRLELVHATDGSRAIDEVSARLTSWVATQQVDLGVDVRVSADDPITALVSASAGASMVVVGSYRSNRLAAYLTGALSNHLPTVSACPVVLVPLTLARH